jgi:hypothetical protein
MPGANFAQELCLLDDLDHRPAFVEHFLALPDLRDDLLGVCLRAMIREFPPVSILGHAGLLHGDPTKATGD